jgi:flagellar motor switch protein FliM
MSTIKQTTASSPYQVLDPCLLGRPVHLLHTFTAHLRDDLSEFFLYVNRRYKASFEVGEVVLARMDKSESAERWTTYSAARGNIACSIERNVLLTVLEYRYGRQHGAIQAALPAGPARITTTEERLGVSLGMQLVKVLAARIDAWDRAAEVPHDFTAVSASPPRKGSWIVSVALQDKATGVEGSLWFSIDNAWMTQLLRGLASARDTLYKPLANPQPLSARLQVTLTGHLMSKEILLGELLDVRVGDVIPIKLSRTDVLLDESRLFTAAVAEHHGKLCLTSFEDVE